MTKKKTISARDAEDMTKIILEDAIEAEKAVVKRSLEKLPKATESKSELKKVAYNIAKPRGIGVIGCGIKIVVMHPESKEEIEFNEDYHGNPEIRAMREDGHRDSKTLELIVSERKWATCAVLAELYNIRSEQTEAINARLNELKAKLGKYKDLAARFRLGFTGDPSDMDTVNHKCREYLLKGEKEA